MREFKHKLNMLWPGGKMAAASLVCWGAAVILYFIGVKEISKAVFTIGTIIFAILIILVIIESYQDRILFDKNVVEEKAIKAGYNKKSFSLPYNNTYIWCEHLDSMYGEKTLVIEKFTKDLKFIKSNSSSSLIAVNLDETYLDDELAKIMIDEFIKGRKYISAIVFVTNSRRTKRILKKYLKQCNARNTFRINSMGDFEKGKKWLVGK